MDNKEKKDEDLKTEEQLKKELEDLVKDLEKNVSKNSSGKGPKIKVVRIGMSNNFFKNLYLDTLFLVFLNVFFILALAGTYKFFDFKWLDFNHYGYVILFAIVFSMIEILIKFVVFKYMLKLILMTIGTILLFNSVLAFVIALLVTPDIVVTSEVGIITFLILFLIIRSMIKNMLTRDKLALSSLPNIKGE